MVECINCDAVVESKVNQSGKQILLMVFSDSAFMCYFVTCFILKIIKYYSAAVPTE